MQIKIGIGIILLTSLAVIVPMLASDRVETTQDPDVTQVKDAISAAELARNKARSVDGEWRDIEELIGGAMAALKAGDYAKAISLAQEARIQGELGYTQAVAQLELQMPSYFKP